MDANKKIQGNTMHLGDSLESNEVACQDNVIYGIGDKTYDLD